MVMAVFQPPFVNPESQLSCRADRELASSDEDYRMEQWIAARARAILEGHPCFRGRGKWIQFQCRNDSLQLFGKVPSFYLKQLAQEALRELRGKIRIDNRITVASPEGEVRCPDSGAPC